MRVHNARARLDEARAALRALSLEERAAALERALAILANPQTRARRELERALCPEISQVENLLAGLHGKARRGWPLEVQAAQPVLEIARAKNRAKTARAAFARSGETEPVALAHLDGAAPDDAQPAARTPREVDAQLIARATHTLRAAHIHPATLRAGLDVAFAAWRAGGFLALAHAQLEARGNPVGHNATLRRARGNPVGHNATLRRARGNPVDHNATLRRARGNPVYHNATLRRARGTATAPGFACTAILCGGALPMPGFETAADALLLGSPVLLRPSARDLWSARAFKIALAEAHPALAAAFEVVKFLHPAAFDTPAENFENAPAQNFAPASVAQHADLREEREHWARFENSGAATAGARAAARERAELRAFLETECVVAYGSDETMRGLAARAHNSRTVFYGHKFSVAIVARGAEERAAPAIARDVCLWDQLGCLSPVSVWALGDADLLADALASALAERARIWPRGALPLTAAAANASACAELEVRAASGRARLLGGEHWWVAREADARFRGSPLYRALRVCPARGLAEFRRALAPHARWLSSVGHAGFAGAKLRALRKACATLGSPRLAPVGQLQAPPLTWRHDGAGALLPLLKNPTPWEREHGEAVGLTGES